MRSNFDLCARLYVNILVLFLKRIILIHISGKFSIYKILNADKNHKINLSLIFIFIFKRRRFFFGKTISCKKLNFQLSKSCGSRKKHLNVYIRFPQLCPSKQLCTNIDEVFRELNNVVLKVAIAEYAN